MMPYLEVLDYWFAGEPLGKEQMNRWWKKDPSVDEWIKNQFVGLVDELFQGEYLNWCQAPEGRLAAIICLDQFPRNMYRGSSKSYQLIVLERSRLSEIIF